MDDYAWWREALATGSFTVEEGNPQIGFYKTKRNGQWVPVAIWRNKTSGELVAAVGNRSNQIAPNDIWISCAKHPVSNEAAKEAFATGLFPGEIAPMGGNMAALPTPEQIALTIEEITKWFASIGGKIKTEVEKDTAANWREKLNALKATADDEHETEKRPILDAGYKVDAKFKPAIKAAEATVKTIRDALTVYLNAEQKRRDDAARAAHEAELKLVEAERARIAAEQAEKMKSDPVAALTSPPPAEPELPMFVPAPKVQAGGQTGKKTSLRTVTRYEVVDPVAVFNFFIDNTDLRECLGLLASKASRAGVVVPGVKKTEEKVAA